MEGTTPTSTEFYGIHPSESHGTKLCSLTTRSTAQVHHIHVFGVFLSAFAQSVEQYREPRIRACSKKYLANCTGGVEIVLKTAGLVEGRERHVNSTTSVFMDGFQKQYGSSTGESLEPHANKSPRKVDDWR